MAEIVVANQRVPDAFAEVLCTLAVTDPDRLDSLLLAAHANGWTLTALGAALGWTREWIRLRVARAEPAVGLPEIPPPPRKVTAMPKPRRRVELKPELIDELREMQAVARTVNGAMDSDHPARRVSEQFSAQLAAYVKQGVTVYYLAQVLGVSPGAVNLRLARHGYRKPPPSYVGTPNETYKNRKVGGLRAAECSRGHAMSGGNLYVSPKGYRNCRACARERYHLRKSSP